MPRNLSLATRQALLGQQTDEAFILLLVLSYVPSGSDGGSAEDWQCVHLAKNETDIVSAVTGASETYISFPIQFNLPASEPGRISTVTMSVTNVSQDLIDTVRSIDVPMLATMYLINVSEPDTIIAQFPGYIWRNLNYNAGTLSGQLSLENTLSEPYPGETMSPYNFPGLFS